MFRHRLWLGVAVIILVGGVVGMAVMANGSSPWTRTGGPTVLKTLDLPDNTLPSASNNDCTPITTRIKGSSSMTNACVEQTPFGLASTAGTVFNGTSEMVQIKTFYPFQGLNPVPRQGMYYTYASGSLTGRYMSFYKSIWDKIDWSAPVDDSGVQVYQLNAPPEVDLKDSAGKRIAVNTFAMAFSDNGDWLVADVPGEGFVRVNLATFDVLPFASSLSGQGDYSVHRAQISITSDGRYVVVQPPGYSRLTIYDLDNCAAASLPIRSPEPLCKSRDYWPEINAITGNLRGIYHPRFLSDTQLSVQVMHDYISGSNFKVSQYTLTAPGVDPKGIPYLGMGDSYASGQGAFNYLDGTDTANDSCHVSSLSYPLLISSQLFSGGHSVACSGAETKDIVGDDQKYRGQNTPRHSMAELAKQGLLSQVLGNFEPGYILQNEFVQTYNPQIITVSIGGNDIGFADIVKACVSPKIFHTTCYSSSEDQQELANLILSKKDILKNTYQTLAKNGAKVYVIGYPQIIKSGGDCANNVHLDADEALMFVNMTNTLDGVIRQAAKEAGVQYVDVSHALDGHRMCEGPRGEVAVNGLTSGTDSGAGPLKFIGEESYHPNALGHQLLFRAILRQTDNFKGAIEPSPPSDSNATLPVPGAPASGRSIKTVISGQNITPDTISSVSLVQLTLGRDTAVLRPSVPYSVTLDDSADTIASGAADGQGMISQPVKIPESVPCGYHMLHLSTQNMLNEPLDIQKLIFVNGSSDDCDGNGQPDAQQPCGLIPASGVDSDNDGMDDACDPFIGSPSAQYQVYLLGSTIHSAKED